MTSGVAKYREQIFSLKPGESFIMPWIDAEGEDGTRPEAGATVGIFNKVFQLSPLPHGLKWLRIK